MYSIKELIEGYKEKKFSPVEIAKKYAERANENKDLNAYISITNDIMQKQAEISEKKWLSGEVGSLEGIPLSYKDNIHTKNVISTSGSKIDKDFIPEMNANLIDQMNREGALMVGKNNMHEFAFGITNNNPFYGPARNPWNKRVISGGSSGGSAVAVAAGLSVASLGTDTGGSVRIPAASCGVVGLKPTYEMLSSEGFTPISPTLDHPGPITQNIDDLTIIMEALTGKDFSYINPAAEDLKGIKIGVPRSFFIEQIESKVLEGYEATLKQLEDLGAHLVEVDVPFAEEALPHIFTIAIAEGGYTHRDRMKAHMDLYGEDVGQVMESSKSIPAADYLHAMHRRDVITAACDELLESVDVLITPTLPALPKPI